MNLDLSANSRINYDVNGTIYEFSISKNNIINGKPEKIKIFNTSNNLLSQTYSFSDQKDNYKVTINLSNELSNNTLSSSKIILYDLNDNPIYITQNVITYPSPPSPPYDSLLLLPLSQVITNVSQISAKPKIVLNDNQKVFNIDFFINGFSQSAPVGSTFFRIKVIDNNNNNSEFSDISINNNLFTNTNSIDISGLTLDNLRILIYGLYSNPLAISQTFNATTLQQLPQLPQLSFLQIPSPPTISIPNNNNNITCTRIDNTTYTFDIDISGGVYPYNYTIDIQNTQHTGIKKMFGTNTFTVQQGVINGNNISFSLRDYLNRNSNTIDSTINILQPLFKFDSFVINPTNITLTPTNPSQMITIYSTFSGGYEPYNSTKYYINNIEKSTVSTIDSGTKLEFQNTFLNIGTYNVKLQIKDKENNIIEQSGNIVVKQNALQVNNLKILPETFNKSFNEKSFSLTANISGSILPYYYKLYDGSKSYKTGTITSTGEFDTSFNYIPSTIGDKIFYLDVSSNISQPIHCSATIYIHPIELTNNVTITLPDNNILYDNSFNFKVDINNNAGDGNFKYILLNNGNIINEQTTDSRTCILSYKPNYIGSKQQKITIEIRDTSNNELFKNELTDLDVTVYKRNLSFNEIYIENDDKTRITDLYINEYNNYKINIDISGGLQPYNYEIYELETRDQKLKDDITKYKLITQHTSTSNLISYDISGLYIDNDSYQKLKFYIVKISDAQTSILQANNQTVNTITSGPLQLNIVPTKNDVKAVNDTFVKANIQQDKFSWYKTSNGLIITVNTDDAINITYFKNMIKNKYQFIRYDLPTDTYSSDYKYIYVRIQNDVTTIYGNNDNESQTELNNMAVNDINLFVNFNLFNNDGSIINNTSNTSIYKFNDSINNQITNSTEQKQIDELLKNVTTLNNKINPNPNPNPTAIQDLKSEIDKYRNEYNDLLSRINNEKIIKIHKIYKKTTLGPIVKLIREISQKI